MQIFKRCNFYDFHSQLATRKAFILEILLTNFGVQQMESRIYVNSYVQHMWGIMALPAAAAEV